MTLHWIKQPCWQSSAQFVLPDPETSAYDGHVTSTPSVVLSPHLDDAVYSCWQALVTGTTVVSFFAGPPADGTVTHWDRITGSNDSAQQMVLRRQEDFEVLRSLGCFPLHFDFLDNQYRQGPLTVEELYAALPQAVFDGSAVYAPAAIGGHPDHCLIRDVGLLLASQGVPVQLYADIPYAVRYGWPPWVNAREPLCYLNVDAYWEMYLDDIMKNGHRLTPKIWQLSPFETDEKVRMMRMYRTQYTALFGGTANVTAHTDVFEYEVTWQLEDVKRLVSPTSTLSMKR